MNIALYQSNKIEHLRAFVLGEIGKNQAFTT